MDCRAGWQEHSGLVGRWEALCAWEVGRWWRTDFGRWREDDLRRELIQAGRMIGSSLPEDSNEWILLPRGSIHSEGSFTFVRIRKFVDPFSRVCVERFLWRWLFWTSGVLLFVFADSWKFLPFNSRFVLIQVWEGISVNCRWLTIASRSMLRLGDKGWYNLRDNNCCWCCEERHHCADTNREVIRKHVQVSHTVSRVRFWNAKFWLLRPTLHLHPRRLSGEYNLKSEDWRSFSLF